MFFQWFWLSFAVSLCFSNGFLCFFYISVGFTMVFVASPSLLAAFGKHSLSVLSNSPLRVIIIPASGGQLGTIAKHEIWKLPGAVSGLRRGGALSGAPQTPNS